jgi:hypothetical protein
METLSKAKQAFNKKLGELQNQEMPALHTNYLKEIVMYEKLLDIQNQLDKLSERIGRA